MNALIVGGDRVQAIRDEVDKFATQLGVQRTEHWAGRKAGDARRTVSARTRVIIVVCKRLSHELMRHVRTQAEEMGVPVIYCRNSVAALPDELQCLVSQQLAERTLAAGRRNPSAILRRSAYDVDPHEIPHYSRYPFRAELQSPVV